MRKTLRVSRNRLRHHPIYVFEENDEICLAQAPVGAPPASSMLDALIASGCRSILALGSAAYWKTPENAFLVPTRACDEGSSYHYLPASPLYRT